MIRYLRLGGSAGEPQHRHHRRRVAGPYDAQRLEAEPAVQRGVIGIARFQVRGHVSAVAAAESFG
jgi:hypothetical protein